jgi:hypothetical protein
MKRFVEGIDRKQSVFTQPGPVDGVIGRQLVDS